jgi:N-acetylmuramoyl-L-alanine amidase
VTSIRRRLAALGLPLALGLAPASGQAPAGRPAARLTVVTASGRSTLSTYVTADHDMVALSDVAALFQGTVHEDAAAGGIMLACKGRAVALTPGNTVVSAAGRLVSLPVPVVRDGRRVLVPVEFLSRAVGPACDVRVEVRPASRLVVIGDARVPRIVVTVDGTAAGARVSFDVTPRAGHAVAQESGRLLIRFDTDALDAAVAPAGIAGLVQGVRVIDPANLMAIDLGPRFTSFRTSAQSTDSGGERFVIDIAASPAEQAPPSPAAAPLSPALPPAAAPETSPGTIVIDPGHGGDDAGVHGPGGTLEKDVTLAVARQLKSAIEQRLGVRVLLTRDADVAVAPDDRTAVANNNKAAMFVSLHANASLKPAVRGATVFFLDAEAEIPDRATGRGAFLPTPGGGSREIDVVPWERAQARYIPASAAMAAAISDELTTRAAASARPVEQAPLRVLVGANMPAVLVELGYLSNPDEEKTLAGETYQALLVQALLDALTKVRATADQPHPPADQPMIAPRNGERRTP